MFSIGDFGAHGKTHSLKTYRKNFHGFMGDERGATMVEYGLLVALLTVIMISTLTSMGDNVVGTFVEADAGFN